jgi:tRNA(Ile)-lysidine synthase
MALTLLAAKWAAKRQISFTALTVDHGLRSESKAEARQVGAWLAARDIPHKILTWRGSKPGSNVQAMARQARYQLLADWCRRHGVIDLLVAHHQEDQAETLMLRLMRGSGVDGLAAMMPVARRNNIRLLRPLLGTPKSRLQASCKKFRQAWVDDPANQNDSFARVRVRKLMTDYAGDGLTAERLSATATRMAQAAAALDQAAQDLLAGAVRFYPEGYAEIDANRLPATPREIGLRTLARVLGAVGGGEYRPRYDRLNSIFDAVCSHTLGRGRTLAGCHLMADKNLVRVMRENRHIEPLALKAGAALLWDGRFEVRLGKVRGGNNTGLQVDALGRAKWSEVRAQINETGVDQRLPRLPAKVRQCLPALWRGNELLAVPQLGFSKNASGRAFKATFRLL